MQLEAGVLGQPDQHVLVFVSGVVVQNNMNPNTFGHLLVNRRGSLSPSRTVARSPAHCRGRSALRKALRSWEYQSGRASSPASSGIIVAANCKYFSAIQTRSRSAGAKTGV